MTALERAEALWASTKGECDPWCIECEESIAVIAECIAAAEAAAYERAALAIDKRRETVHHGPENTAMGPVLLALEWAAARVRSLAEKGVN